MTRIAVSGHRGLTPDVVELVDHAIRAELADEDPGTLVGISCLADGADQIFARAVIDAGGRLEVIVPARAYREGLPAEAHAEYDRLLASASAITRLDRDKSTSDAHMAGSTTMLGTADRLLAVWDGQPSRAPGGTADVVEDARADSLPVTIIWPPGHGGSVRNPKIHGGPARDRRQLPAAPVSGSYSLVSASVPSICRLPSPWNRRCRSRY